MKKLIAIIVLFLLITFYVLTLLMLSQNILNGRMVYRGYVDIYDCNIILDSEYYNNYYTWPNDWQILRTNRIPYFQFAITTNKLLKYKYRKLIYRPIINGYLRPVWDVPLCPNF